MHCSSNRAGKPSSLFELDCLPEGTSQELWDGIILEKYTDMKPRMFRKEEFEKILAAGIIKPEEHAQLVDGFILKAAAISESI